MRARLTVWSRAYAAAAIAAQLILVVIVDSSVHGHLAAVFGGAAVAAWFLARRRGAPGPLRRWLAAGRRVGATVSETAVKASADSLVAHGDV